ncbi:MAG: plasmid mobilization protein [Aristaeellaceae bacterium]
MQIKLWLNDEEADVLRQDVKRTGLTQSKYLRALIMKREIREKLPIDYYHMLTEISRIGNNLNQIARIANQQPDGSPDLMQTLVLIRRLYEMALECVQNTHQKTGGRDA